MYLSNATSILTSNHAVFSLGIQKFDFMHNLRGQVDCTNLFGNFYFFKTKRKNQMIKLLNKLFKPVDASFNYEPKE